ncbi:unnamed protein product [Tenebrio molitor]|nr:unnamed protein product [Tenebrio molitor]
MFIEVFGVWLRYRCPPLVLYGPSGLRSIARPVYPCDRLKSGNEYFRCPYLRRFSRFESFPKLINTALASK